MDLISTVIRGGVRRVQCFIRVGESTTGVQYCMYICKMYICSDGGYSTGDTIGILIDLPKRSSSKLTAIYIVKPGF